MAVKKKPAKQKSGKKKTKKKTPRKNRTAGFGVRG